jgi:xanthine dehydrogenase iron-sulfur cluster and FAD-binding subunit A
MAMLYVGVTNLAEILVTIEATSSGPTQIEMPMTNTLWENYLTPASLPEALDLLAQHGPQARLIAGGTDLIIELDRKQRPNLRTLIDISRLPNLNQIIYDGQTLRLGPLVTHNQALANPLVQSHALPLALACWEVGAPQIRNRATIAGNLVTASPANDTITPLWALGARLTLSATSGQRTLPIADFYTGLRKTALRADEMLTSIEIPALPANGRGVFLKLGLRKAQAISVVNVAAILHFEQDETTAITHAEIALGSVAPTIIALPQVTAYLLGQQLTEAVIDRAARIAAETPSPIDDVRSTAAYRRAMIQVLVGRALRAIVNRQTAAALPKEPVMLWGGYADQPPTAPAQAGGSTLTAQINGVERALPHAQGKTLLRALREDAGLTGTKEGCAEGECGACTVFLEGAAVMSCLVPAPAVANAQIVTVEGLASNPDTLHPIQAAFIEKGAVQCGYCTPGFLMAGAKLLDEFPDPTTAQIEQSITGNLCRCTGYYNIIEAFRRAAELATATTST